MLPSPADLLVVQVCDFPANGQGYYRYHEPSRHLSRLGGVVVVDCDPLHRFLPLLAESADVLVLQFFDWDWLPVIERRRSRGRVTVVEANDYYFDIQPFNPGSLPWADRLEQEGFKQFLGAADAVQTTSEELARRWAPWARRVAVFPNQLPDVPPLTALTRRPLTVGWGGSGSHLADWYTVCPVVQSWLESRPDVHLAVMTDECARSFVRLAPERYHFHKPGSLGEYLTFLRSLDIGLAPLLPTDFNRCRSDLKYLEYAAHGVAGVYSDLEPFRATVQEGQTGVFFRSGDELRRRLDELASDAELRQHLRQGAHSDVSSSRLLSNHVSQRLRFYRDLCPRPASVSLPPEVISTAVRDGDYYQLRQGKPERILSASLDRPADTSAIADLMRLVEEHPNYQATLHRLGHLLIEAGQPESALDHLDRALRTNPDSCQGLCEAARALEAIGDVPAARLCLERILTINPAHPVAWKRLLALLESHPEPNGHEWAESAARTHPSSYALVLAGLNLLSDDNALSRLESLIASHASRLTREERSTAVAAFSRAIGQRVRSRLDSPEALRLLLRAAEAFPESGRVAALLGQALDLLGRREESQEQYARALTLARQAEVCRLEFTRDDPLLRRCLVAEFARGKKVDQNTD